MTLGELEVNITRAKNLVWDDRNELEVDSFGDIVVVNPAGSTYTLIPKVTLEATDGRT